MLIAMMGGACSACGYRKNYAALELRHVVEGTKAFQLDLRSLTGMS